MMGKFEKDTGAGRFFQKYHGLRFRMPFFFNQSDLLCDMAKHEDFIVMGKMCGRCTHESSYPTYQYFHHSIV